MEIRQLKYFVCVAEMRSFSEASRRMFLSQSAISQQIKALEDELNTILFVRSSHNVSLTESGEMLLPLARKVIQTMKKCQEQMTDLNEMLCGELNIGITLSLEPYVRDTIIRFLKSFPKVKLNIYYKSLAELHELLIHNNLDLIICINQEQDYDDAIDYEPIMEYKLCAIMRDTHPLANHKKLRFQDMQLQGFVLPEPGIRDRNAIEHYLHAHTGDVNVRAIINDPHALLSLMRNTNFITILSEKAISGYSFLRAIEIEELSTPVTAYAQTLHASYLKRSARIFIRMLKENCKEQKLQDA